MGEERERGEGREHVGRRADKLEQEVKEGDHLVMEGEEGGGFVLLGVFWGEGEERLGGEERERKEGKWRRGRGEEEEGGGGRLFTNLLSI